MNSSSGDVNHSSAVTIKFNPERGFYRVDLDLRNTSHREVGRQYSLALLQALPNTFEAASDKSLQESLEAAKMPFAHALDVANKMMGNMPKDYRDEIDGMASVFAGNPDGLGNGQLSANKLILSVMQGEVIDDNPACSAAAAFGGGSATGHTIVGRNNDWSPDPEMDGWNALFVFHNGERSIGGTGSLGELFPSNIFNRWNMFAGSLLSYPDSPSTPSHTAEPWSISVDLRHAMENSQSLPDLERHFTALANRASYTEGSLILVADKDTAHVIEFDKSRREGARVLVRTATSRLIDGVSWGIDSAIASVNSFVLPGGFANHLNDDHNKRRFESFQEFLRRPAIDPAGMQEIMGYTSSDGRAGTSGAIFRLGIEDCATFQSLVMRLDTYEMWLAYSGFGQAMPYRPVYHKVLDGDPFE